MRLQTFDSSAIDTKWTRKIVLTLIVILAVVLLEAQNAHADRGRFYGHGRHGGFAYRGYHAGPHFGMFAPYLPLDALLLTVGLTHYYYYDGYYYRPVSDGYVVVSKPDTVYVNDAPTPPDSTLRDQAADETGPAPTETKTVRVDNSNGSHTPVRLELVEGKWIGPRGEEYDTFPTNEQLKSAYGF